ncbi:MAG: hypothetical protein ACOX3X_03265 [Eubacteriales bacterium]|jgi:hypothetical protein
MDSGLGDKIREILSDPQAMDKIMQIVSGLTTQQSQPQPPNNGYQTSTPASSTPAGAVNPLSALSSLTSKPQDTLSALSPVLGGSDKRLALLNSLRPLLREEKRHKLDSLKTALTLASVIGNIKKT